ncbi:DUF5924 family protein [Thauera sinica]|uniref:DUF5924 family protein n=1 Tax=Thauera sinica TaxID=2665146 RepID=A0ABW1ASI6_9RHOO|nr:DUF5924 family protein [Thauera sp. K11]ATE61122.1 hypothetical protein CCZ27_15300 [Thauera sp. K11]
MIVWKTRLLRLFVLVRRYPGVIAAFGFVSGLVSFFLVDRHEGFARIIAVLMLASWVWLILEQLLCRLVERWFGFTLPPPLLRYATQLIHQESLFFALPFFATTTSWNSGQFVFTGLLGAAALVSIIDPVYYRRLAPRRWLYLTYHTLTLFAVLLAALPVILQTPTPQSYRLALGVAVLLSFPSVAGSLPLRRWWRGAVLIALMAALAAAGWWLRLWVPPATLWLHHVAVTAEFDGASRVPGQTLREIDAAQLAAQGLYAYTAINAPQGLQERIWHVWMRDGVEVDRIALDIRGGRREGYRAWTHKQNFPPQPAGRWQVKVLTDAGQMIGTLRFQVTEAQQ